MSGDRKNILLVEDQAPIALSEKRALEESGYGVTVSNSGQGALEAVGRDPGIDLVLMDIDLGGGIDGTEAARRILETREIPIVFLSGYADTRTVGKIESIASYGYVVKSAGTVVLDAAIKMAFSLFEAKRIINDSDTKQKVMLSNISDVIGIFDGDGTLKYVSPNIEKWYGWRRDEILGTSSMSRVHPDDLEEMMEALRILLATENLELTRSYRQRCKDGSYKNVEVSAKNLLSDPSVNGILLTYHDITYRTRLEEALRRSEEKYRFLVDTAPIGIFQLTEGGDYLFFNEVEMRIFECRDGEEFLALYGEVAKRWEDAESLEAFMTALKREKQVRNLEKRIRLRDGKEKWILLSANLDESTSTISGISVDITARKQDERRISDLLEEKDLVLKEVHHRIKNNMSVMSSLLSLHASVMEEPRAVTALKDARGRLRSMMLLYEKLYQSAGFTRVAIKDYLPELIDQIVENIPSDVKLRIDQRMDDFDLDSKKLQPLAIIVNELITNIVKYAFPGRESGLVKVSALLRDGIVTVAIQDDGVGLPASVDFEKSPGFGFMLVENLTKQLQGRIRIEREEGTKIVIEFKK